MIAWVLIVHLHYPVTVFVPHIHSEKECKSLGATLTRVYGQPPRNVECYSYTIEEIPHDRIPR